jgi:2-oxoglutarate ferredoxin oxidoreductase subunit gamma
MTLNKRTTIQFCGFGGQGIVLSSIVYGSASVIGAGLHAVQTQSYGSEARGGECQAELILSNEQIGSPIADEIDILVAMSQLAYNRYSKRLRPGGTLLLDTEMVDEGDPTGIKVFKIPATSIAEDLGSKISANMVMLGFLQSITGIVSKNALLDAIRSNVNPKYLELNNLAVQRGIAWAEEKYSTIRV